MKDRGGVVYWTAWVITGAAFVFLVVFVMLGTSPPLIGEDGTCDAHTPLPWLACH